MDVVIFAGGKSSRMGRDKALLPFRGERSLAYYQMQRLQHHFTVYISCKSKIKFDFEGRFIEEGDGDTFAPLIGIETGLQTLGSFVALGVDIPFISTRSIQTLIDSNGEFDVIISQENGRLNPLFALYNQSFLPYIKQAKEENFFKLTDIITRAKHRVVDFGISDEFINLNYPDEYEKYKEME